MRPFEKYGEVIARLRKQKRWSQEELADKAKLDPKSIVQIEKAKRNPTLKTLQKIAAALNISVSKLLEG